MIVTTRKDWALFKDWISTKSEVAFDTETDGLYGDMVGMSFADNGHSGHYIPVKHNTGETHLSIDEIRDELSDILQNVKIIGWNINYEFSTLERHGVKWGDYEEAQVISWLVNENDPIALKRRAMQDLRLRKAVAFKDVVDLKTQTAADIPIKTMAPYAIQDALLTWRLYDLHMSTLMSEEEIYQEYLDIDKPCIEVLHSMRRKGVKTDVELIKGIKHGLLLKIDELKQRIYTHAGEEFNLNSSKQKQFILYEKLAIPVPSGCYTDKGSPQTNKKALKEIKHPIAKDLLVYSKLQKIVSSFTDSIIDNVDAFSRIRPSFNQVGTVAGRWSCSAPNFQQMPKKGGIRRAFIAEKGYKLIVADYSQLELRIAAHFSKDPVMLEAFNNGIDLHSLTAAKIMGVTIEEFTAMMESDDLKISSKAETMRFLAKTINFGIIYGMGVREDLGITKEFIDKYFRVFSRLKMYINAHNSKVSKLGYTRTLSKRKRRLEEVFSDDFGERSRALRQLFSAHIQGSAADIMKKAMVMIYRKFAEEGLDAVMIAQIHDELIVEAKEEHVFRAMQIIKECMETSYTLRVPLEAEPHFADNWEDAKSGKVKDISLEEIIEGFCEMEEAA